MESISDLIHQGKDIQVIDHVTGEDFTSITLTQIILEQEKKRGGSLPISVLSSLIQIGGDQISSLQRRWLTSKSIAQSVDNEITERIDLLIQKGEFSKEEGKNILDKILRVSHINKKIKGLQLEDYEVGNRMIEKLLFSRNIPTKEDVKKLSQQLEELNSKIDTISKPE